MSQLSGFWLHYGRALLFLAWIGAFITPLVYGLKARFWESEIGMHFWTYSVVIWLNLTPQVLFVLVGDYPGRGVIVLIIFHLTVAVIWWRAVIFLKLFYPHRTIKGSVDTKRLNGK